jgi:hypothetical protein
MKNLNSLTMAIAIFAFAFWTTSCQEDDLATPELTSLESTFGKADIPATVLTNTATVSGKPIREYTKDWWNFALTFDCANNPLIGALVQNSTQAGPVHYLVGTRDGVSTRYIDIEIGKTILVPVINVIKNYPSPDPSFRPARGQTVEQFLKLESSQFISQVTEKRATLDGRPIAITEVNRLSTGLFPVKGNQDLVNCLDCVTGQVQSGVSDGYWVALKDLGRGNHILRITAQVPQKGIQLDVTYNINVR